MQKIAIVFVLSVLATTSAQYMSPYQTWGMGPMWSHGIRGPGMMQTSQVNSMTYPTWRNHPLFRMAAVTTPDSKTVGGNLGQDPTGAMKIPEVLSHMALAAQNVKPFYDTISGFLLDSPKARAATFAPAYLQGMNDMSIIRANMMNQDDCGPQEANKWERGMMDWVY